MASAKHAGRAETPRVRPFLQWSGGNSRIYLVDPTHLGSSQTCEILIADPEVDGVHCRIACQDGRWTIRDLGSRLGTLVNGKAVTESPLEDGDTLRIGKVHLRYMAPANPSKIDPLYRQHDQMALSFERRQRELDLRSAELTHLVETIRKQESDQAQQSKLFRVTSYELVADLSRAQIPLNADRARLQAEQSAWQTTVESEQAALANERAAFEAYRRSEETRLRAVADEQQRRLADKTEAIEQQEQSLAAREGSLETSLRDIEIQRRAVKTEKEEIAQLRKQLRKEQAVARQEAEAMFERAQAERIEAGRIADEARRQAEHATQRDRDAAEQIEARRRELQALLDRVDCKRKQLSNVEEKCQTYQLTLVHQERLLKERADAVRDPATRLHERREQAIENQTRALEEREMRIAAEATSLSADASRVDEVVDTLERLCAKAEEIVADLVETDERLTSESFQHRELAIRFARVRKDLEGKVRDRAQTDEREQHGRRSAQLDARERELHARIAELESRIARFQIEKRHWDEECKRQRVAIERDRRDLEHAVAEHRRITAENTVALFAQRESTEKEKSALGTLRRQIQRMQLQLDEQRTDVELERRQWMEERTLWEQFKSINAMSGSRSLRNFWKSWEAKLKTERDRIRELSLSRRKNLDSLLRDVEQERAVLHLERRRDHRLEENVRRLESEVIRYRDALYRTHEEFQKRTEDWREDKVQYRKTIWELERDVENLAVTMLEEPRESELRIARSDAA